MTIRVLHCPTTVGGNPQGLARAERELGLDSRSVAFTQTSFAYEPDEVLATGRLELEAKRYLLLWRALRHFDVVHFNFGQPILPPVPARKHGALGRAHATYAGAVAMRDVALLRRAGKGICVTYQGDDARQGDVSRRWETSIAAEVDAGYYTPETDAAKREAIARFDVLAHRIYYLNPDLARFLPARARFMPYGHVDPRAWTAPPRGPLPERPLVVHAPSHRGAKGTRHVLAAVEQLRAEGVPFEFELVEGVSQAEARARYERADLLVDQLLAGWYGGIAVEAMALGTPVLCYLRDDDFDVLPTEMRAGLPLLRANQATVADVLREWLTVRRKELREAGARSRAFVERWHDPLSIAAGLKADYETILR